MNDPNGLVEYNGVYHVFYQADPEHLINENIGWGHKISSRFVTLGGVPAGTASLIKDYDQRRMLYWECSDQR